jgi:hypothetical protein
VIRTARHLTGALSLLIVASLAAGSFSTCLEDGTNAARAMACCKAHDGCADAFTARDCCKHERASDASAQMSAVSADAVVAPLATTSSPQPVATLPLTAPPPPRRSPIAAESPPLFLVQHTFRV